MPTPNPIKAALRRGEKQIGCWLTLNSPSATELIAGAGFDWVLIDMEHTAISESEVVDHLRAAAAGGRSEPIVRMPWNDPVMTKRLLDSGARSIIVPYVQTVEEAGRAVASTRYPPAGTRGFAGTHRGNSYGRNKEYWRALDDEIFLALQVESPQAVALAGEIAAIDGVDCVFVGPNDLAVNMGRIGEAHTPAVQAVIGSVIAPVKAAGKAPGVLDFNADNAKRWLEAGFDFVAVGSDTSLLVSGVNSLVAAFR